MDRQIRTVWKKGTPAVNPVAPPLQWDADYKELNLCILNVTAGLSAITQDKIKDTRADSSVCGWVTGLIDRVDTSTLFAQWDAAYEKAFAETEDYLEAQKAAWEAFFENVAQDLIIPVPSLEDAGKILRVSSNSDQYELDSPDTSLLREGGIAEAAAVGRAIKKSRPRNLLDNSDFRNPVNQRGHTIWTGAIWTHIVDRWYINLPEGVTATLTESGLSVSGDCFIQQRFVKGYLRADAVYTCAVYYSDGSVELSSKPQFNNSEFGAISISVEANKTVTCIALYEGEYTAETLPEYQPKGYGAELAECLRYFQKSVVVEFSKEWYSLHQGGEKFYIPMRIAPTVTATSGHASVPISVVDVNIFGFAWTAESETYLNVWEASADL